MLKSLFIKFDHKCIKHNVFKRKLVSAHAFIMHDTLHNTPPPEVYTIGDCYIVIGFSDANRRDPPMEAKNVLEMGFSMIESLRAFRKEQKDPMEEIDMRIGIHIVINYLILPRPPPSLSLSLACREI